ncbi:rhodanese-related sulfurtransferase [Actinocorallia herbida]|uniref:Rhodanese-related sulfurtransferase n=1 Tax=Actinocorallia herbida TaxID=58109 RepID=A0A3N1D576_9ACTN|nr:rhodanese-like domain-containing protein [Actinocorallia herbida]ROO88650.1 rhodanese-related sulfurtransferase [Actinocorallia herbida]
MHILDPARVRALGSGALLLDVRTPAEFESAHLPGSVNVPLDTLPSALASIEAQAAGRPVVLVCRSGARARQAQRLVPGAVLEGGVQAWESDGGSLVRGKQTWSLERQVRFAAGALVFAAVLASLAWPPALVVAAFVGAGLVFAGVTDTCLMGRGLARLPWNR